MKDRYKIKYDSKLDRFIIYDLKNKERVDDKMFYDDAMDRWLDLTLVDRGL